VTGETRTAPLPITGKVTAQHSNGKNAANIVVLPKAGTRMAIIVHGKKRLA
jgi:hypothetical protein